MKDMVFYVVLGIILCAVLLGASIYESKEKDAMDAELNYHHALSEEYHDTRWGFGSPIFNVTYWHNSRINERRSLSFDAYMSHYGNVKTAEKVEGACLALLTAWMIAGVAYLDYVVKHT